MWSSSAFSSLFSRSKEVREFANKYDTISNDVVLLYNFCNHVDGLIREGFVFGLKDEKNHNRVLSETIL